MDRPHCKQFLLLRPKRPPKSQKSLEKSLFGGPQKSRRKVEKYPKTPKFGFFGVLFDFWGYFRGLFCRPPKRLFSRFFWDFWPGGPGDSCKWSPGSQSYCHPFVHLRCHGIVAIARMLGGLHRHWQLRTMALTSHRTHALWS